MRGARTDKRRYRTYLPTVPALTEKGIHKKKIGHEDLILFEMCFNVCLVYFKL